MRYFFYGTLIDPDIRRHVMGDLAPASVEPARLPGWRRFALKGASFPIARPDRTASIDGVLARGLDESAGRLLDIYEGPGYGRINVQAIDVQGKAREAVLFVEDGSVEFVVVPQPWDYEAWVRRHKKEFMAQLKTQPWAPR
jgi:hypothetical protein